MPHCKMNNSGYFWLLTAGLLVHLLRHANLVIISLPPTSWDFKPIKLFFFVTVIPEHCIYNR